MFEPAKQAFAMSIVLCCTGIFAHGASAHELTEKECAEGGEFIKHAAMARDYGLSRNDFLQRMQDDLQAIQAFPPHLRWFVQDEDDEVLLISAAERVFDTPRRPEEHESEFIAACAQGERVSSQENR